MNPGLTNVLWCSVGILMGILSTLLVLRARIADIKAAEAILDARRGMLDRWQARLERGES